MLIAVIVAGFTLAVAADPTPAQHHCAMMTSAGDSAASDTGAPVHSCRFKSGDTLAGGHGCGMKRCCRHHGSGAATAAVAVPAGKELSPQKPGAREKCPVCGMFIAQYPEFLAQAVLQDRRVFFFDGPKDLFHFIASPAAYLGRNDAAAPQRLFVTDYYAQKAIDAKKARYVFGSDVLGPMGRELIPFQTEDDAKEFLKDHGGAKILRFDDVNQAVLKELDR